MSEHANGRGGTGETTACMKKHRTPDAKAEHTASDRTNGRSVPSSDLILPPLKVAPISKHTHRDVGGAGERR